MRSRYTSTSLSTAFHSSHCFFGLFSSTPIPRSRITDKITAKGPYTVPSSAPSKLMPMLGKIVTSSTESLGGFGNIGKEQKKGTSPAGIFRNFFSTGLGHCRLLLVLVQYVPTSDSSICCLEQKCCWDWQWTAVRANLTRQAMEQF